MRGGWPLDRDGGTSRRAKLVLVEAGDVVGVDGVASAGEAVVVPWHGAPIEMAKGEGDAIVAGARIVSGRLRIVTAWAGGERAWARATSSPQVRPDVSAPMVRLARMLLERRRSRGAGGPRRPRSRRNRQRRGRRGWLDRARHRRARCACHSEGAASSRPWRWCTRERRWRGPRARHRLLQGRGRTFDAAGRTAIAVAFGARGDGAHGRARDRRAGAGRFVRLSGERVAHPGARRRGRDRLHASPSPTPSFARRERADASRAGERAQQRRCTPGWASRRSRPPGIGSSSGVARCSSCKRQVSVAVWCRGARVGARCAQGRSVLLGVRSPREARSALSRCRTMAPRGAPGRPSSACSPRATSRCSSRESR